jgi:hypothetical protein
MALTLPIQAPIFKSSDLQDEGLTLLNQWFTTIAQQLNAQAGHAGPVSFKNGIDLNGNQISNVGSPLTPSDVVTLDYANANLGASAIQPKLEATSANPLSTYRQLNSQVQRERYSSFLNDVLNTAPTANTATVSGLTSGGSTTITVSSGFHQRVDGSQVPFAARSDTKTNPASFSITSLTRSGGIVTAVLGSSFTGGIGSQINVTGTNDPSFQGVFYVLTVVGSTITYAQNGPNAGTVGGTISLVITCYYTISRNQNQLNLVEVGADTWSARVAASFDGTTIIAVVALNSSGLDPVNSAAGASPPVTGAAIPVIRRL